MPKKKSAPELCFPRLSITNWTILGVDLSLSRTGFAVLHIENGEARWAEVGSVAPADSEDATWARGVAIGMQIRNQALAAVDKAAAWNVTHPDAPWGVVVAMEFPDPTNSYLMALNGIVQAVLWSSSDTSLQEIAPVYRLAINAATLRSCLHLNIKGASADKNINLVKAYTYIDKATYPSLDTDACDAVLLAMMARWAAMVFSGQEAMVPPAPLAALCTSEQRVKVRASRKKGEPPIRIETPRALLHNPATWTALKGPVEIRLKHRDATSIIPRSSKPFTVFL